MKAFAVVLPVWRLPPMAGPYVSTKSEFKGDEEGYAKTVHQGRQGYGGNLKVVSNHTLKLVVVSPLLMV